MLEPQELTLSRQAIIAGVKTLPEWAQRYIYELETRCDPSGDVRTIADLREQVRALSLLLCSYLESKTA